MNIRTIIALYVILTFIFAESNYDFRIKYQLYFESLCPYSVTLITESVSPAVNVPNFLDIADVEFIPFGNVKHNQITGEFDC